MIKSKKGRDLRTKFCACKVFTKLIRRKDGIKPSYQIVQNNKKNPNLRKPITTKDMIDVLVYTLKSL